MANVTVTPDVLKYDSGTQISPRAPGVLTFQGNSGGLTLIGGSASGDDLTLQSTSHATKGYLSLDDASQLWLDFPGSSFGTGALALNAVEFKPTGTITMHPTGFNVQATRGILIDPVTDQDGIGGIFGMYFNPTCTLGASAGISCVQGGGTYTNTKAPGIFGSWLLFQATPGLISATANISPYGPTVFYSHPAMTFNSTGTATLAGAGVLPAGSAGSIYGFDWPTFINSSTGTFNVSHSSLEQVAVVTQNSGTLTVSKLVGLKVRGPTFTGTPTITEHVGVDIENIATAGKTTTAVALRSAIVSGTTQWCILDTGGADSAFKGNVRFGDNTAPTASIDVVGKLLISNAGLVTKYNNISTVSGGVPSELATIDLTAVAAAKAAVALYTPVTTGMFRISVVLTLTQAATTSSTLAGTAAGQQGVSVGFQTGDGNSAVTQTIPLTTKAGTAIVNTSAANTVGTTLIGHEVIYANTTAITYNIGYTSVGVTPMQYSIHIKVEAM